MREQVILSLGQDWVQVVKIRFYTSLIQHEVSSAILSYS